jgi:hypothetical protein
LLLLWRPVGGGIGSSSGIVSGRGISGRGISGRGISGSTSLRRGSRLGGVGIGFRRFAVGRCHGSGRIFDGL